MSSFQSENLNQAARMLRNVSHPSRIAMISLLEERKTMTVTEIQEALGLTQSMTSQHLSALKSVGVVACDRLANQCHYHIANRNVLKLLECVQRCAASQP